MTVIRPDNPATPPRFLAGLDIGQMADPTALVIAERQMVLQGLELEPRFDARFLERVPLHTPYPRMVAGVKTRLDAIGEPVALIIDATGVGRGVVDLFRHVGLHPVAITITAGDQIHTTRWDEWHVPKRTLVMAFQVALQQGRFRVAKDLPLAQTLVKEGQAFQWKVSKAGNDLYGAWREGTHDDLLLAAACLVWWGDRFAPREAPGTQLRKAIATGNPLARPHQQQAVGTGRVW